MEQIQVTGFIHHNQPYGTDHIDGIWKPWTIADIKRLEKELKTLGYDYWGWKQKCKRDEIDLTKRRITKNMGTLTGTITKGSTTSRLFQHTSTVDNAGKSFRLDSVTRDEIERGEKVSVAM